MATAVASTTSPRAHELSSLGRARQIAAVLARRRLWHLVELLALDHLLPFEHRLRNAARRSELITPVELRAVLEELGPTFMKLGQVLSSRADLLPEEFRLELARLQDHAPAVAGDAVLEIVESELGAPVAARFRTFDETPLATGSIGQAHLAVASDGTELVVKVRRPGAVEQIDEDLKLLRRLAGIVQGRLQAAHDMDLAGMVAEFDASLRAEVDYMHEGHNAERFAQNFRDSTEVHVPRIFWDATTSRVLTMDRIVGMRITDAASMKEAGCDPRTVAGRATRIVLKMMLEDGFFHADLHPGNLFVESASRIGLIDFGMVGVIDSQTRAGLEQLLLGIDAGDADVVVDALLDLGVARGSVDRLALRRDIDRLLVDYRERAGGEPRLGDLLNEVFSAVRTYRLRLPSSLSMLAKTVLTAEGMVEQLDPSFQIAEISEAYMRKLVLAENSPRRWARRLEREAPDLMWLAVEAPKVTRRLLSKLEKGQLAMAVEAKGLDPYVHRLERTANRIVLAMVLSALIVAAAVVVSVYRPGGGGLLDIALAVCLASAGVAGAALTWAWTRRTVS